MTIAATAGGTIAATATSTATDRFRCGTGRGPRRITQRSAGPLCSVAADDAVRGRADPSKSGPISRSEREFVCRAQAGGARADNGVRMAALATGLVKRSSGAPVSADSSATVNPHYLDHVVGTSASHEVSASEDIVTGNGIKLVAKGTRIDPSMRDRLLDHKLRKPLEDCLEVADSNLAGSLEAAGEALLENSLLLRAMCEPGRARSAPASLAGLELSSPMRSLLSVYVQSQGGKLDHAAGVAMIALTLARKLLPGDVERHKAIATAGLAHDVGELYIDPAYLDRSTRMDAAKWRHIVSHPLVAYRVLVRMAGVEEAVAEAVLLHHERLDGFGYPRGIGGDEFSIDGQIVAAAEWLMALIESDSTPLMRARMAERLIPGEFSASLLAAVSAAARAVPQEAIELSGVPPLQEAVPRVARMAATLGRFDEARGWIDESMETASRDLRMVLDSGLQRTMRIRASFSSTGLNPENVQLVLGELAALNDAAVYAEVTTLVGELEWRLRELERTQRLRASLLPESEGAVVLALIERLKGTAAVAA